MKYFLLLLISINLFSYSQAVKEKKIYPMGKKIYEKRCQNIELFSTKEQLTSLIKKSCKPLKAKYLEALTIYLWDSRDKSFKTKVSIQKVSHDEKCPICGMWVYKYPKWVAQLQSGDTHKSFDGVKDMMKYYNLHPSNDIVVVRDYYSQKVMDGRLAFYVVGSDVYGPMGNELIPFKLLSEAEVFKVDHKGKKIIKFNDIKNEDLN